MIIKTFTAESSAAALKRVKAEMGGEAIVLKTRQVSDESSQTMFEVTACLEKPTVDQSSKSLSSGVSQFRSTSQVRTDTGASEAERENSAE